ncbi:MAG TPA: glucose 1-dehydrogenase [bacterium]|nr:glucose 1-dehydrogenase [bacterium]
MDIREFFSLKGETAIVTGAAKGLGKEISMAFADAGANIVVADMDFEAAREAEREILKKGVECLVVKTDVGSVKDVEEMVGKAFDKFKRIDILVNNAGIVNNYPAEELSVEDWDKVVKIDLSAVFYCSKTAAREMIKQKKGAIINIASMSGMIVNTPQPQSHYNAAKAGVIQLTRSLAAEWAQYNIRVNSISPGYMGTEMVKRVLSQYGKYWFPLIPMGRVGEPSEIKGPALFLASRAASYVTGSNIVMDGGYTVW